MITKQSRRAFTLIEILVVLGIIMLLAAILFPVFSRMKERGYQTNCASNLKQIHAAVMMYHNDYERYPASLAFVISDNVELANFDSSGVAGAPVTNTKGKGYFKGGMDALMCLDDDNDDLGYSYSSYGDLSTNIAYGAATATHEPAGRYVWNYWGYDADGWTYLTQAEAATAGNAYPTRLATGSGAYDRLTNPINYSLSNRYAPASTIITHCVFHRVQTANDLATPHELYSDATASLDARDIVLRLDGSAKAVDVSSWKGQYKWTAQTK